jgi:thioredoxin-dependent peroxiredoxin
MTIKTLPNKILLLAIIFFAHESIFAKTKTETMKIQIQQSAPDFTIKDVNGKSINLADYKGNKVMLTFYRNVGCPVCNARFHELQEQSDYFKSKGLVLISVYESKPENMKKYLEGENPYAIMVPNPELNLYQLYNIEKSSVKLMKGMFHGAMGKMKLGKKLFREKIKQDGNNNRISADFLIDEEGKVATAYYGKFIGDHLSIDEIKKFLH